MKFIKESFKWLKLKVKKVVGFLYIMVIKIMEDG